LDPVATGPLPLGAPAICGALGDYDESALKRIALSFERPFRSVHRDKRSILLMDREPLRWAGRRESGLGWIEGALWHGDAGDWREAARKGACGLVIEGRRRFLHSAVNGLSHIYWIDRGKATYFASRIDPLVQAGGELLSIDWDAWISTIVFRFPIGERTPFAEIRRLPQFSTLRRRLGRSRRESPSWPWAEVEPDLSLADAAEAIVAGMGEASPHWIATRSVR
jgi:hypothetical protein